MRYSSQTPPRRRPTVPAEQADEAPGQIERDQVDAERGIPIEHNEPIEQIERSDESGSSLFED